MSDPLPTNGSIFSFRTSPFSDFAPRVTNRYGTLKVLGSTEICVVIGVLDSILHKPPSLNDIRNCNILCEHRFVHTGRPAVWSVNAEWWNLSDLDEMTLLGTLPVEITEMQLASKHLDQLPGSVIATLNYANYAAEGEWRWANDRAALVSEQESFTVQEAVKRANQKERQSQRLRGLTWDQLLGETPFERWSSSLPFPSAEFTLEARNVIHNTCRALQALGKKPRKIDVRRFMRECVEWFNKADEEAGGVIETDEREDICAVLEEIAHVARQISLVNEIDNWRVW